MACCGAGQYRIFPLGQSNGEILVAEIKLTRYCKFGDGGGSKNEIKFKGVINLGKIVADTVQFISNIDSVEFTSCQCNLSNYHEKSTLLDRLMPYYKKALIEARKWHGFIQARPISYHYHDKEEPIMNYQFDTAEVPTFFYKEQPIALKPTTWVACGYYRRIMELRSYEIAGKEIVIMTATCNVNHGMPDSKIATNQNNFKNIDSAITFCPTTFHGENRDFVIKN